LISGDEKYSKTKYKSEKLLTCFALWLVSAANDQPPKLGPVNWDMVGQPLCYELGFKRLGTTHSKLTLILPLIVKSFCKLGRLENGESRCAHDGRLKRNQQKKKLIVSLWVLRGWQLKSGYEHAGSFL
jgi:hypothetical protein